MSDSLSTKRNKKNRTLTVEIFDGLLDCLDADREQAAIKYEELRLSLHTFFAVRGAADPNALTDETLNRVAYRLAEGQVITTNQPIYYALAVARNVWREQLAQPYKTISLTEFPPDLPFQAVSPEVLWVEFEQRLRTEEKFHCFTNCIASLSKTDQALLREYHQDTNQANSKKRQAMAQRLGVTLGSLRNRISRIRDRVLNCTQECLKNKNEL